jgi:Holliday junction DNA helicase RuvA
MISIITGKIVERGPNRLCMDTGGICYEVLIPTAVMQRIEEFVRADGSITLRTYHYHQLEPSRGFPVLIGFLNEVEKDFFQVFITVSGIGPRAALKALNKPISAIARAIDEGNISFLKSLPGIGEQRAREIVAKLQNKVGKFGLIQDAAVGAASQPAVHVPDIAREALDVLMQLQYKKPEAQAMIKKALDQSPDIETIEELLNVVYRQRAR